MAATTPPTTCSQAIAATYCWSFLKTAIYCLLDQAAPASQRVNPTKGTGGGQGPSAPQVLAYIHVRGGKAVRGDLEEYIEKSL